MSILSRIADRLARPIVPAPPGVGPDFFCVGLQKAGTQWLYDQLQGHADFWMPPYKEIHYFDRGFPDEKLAAEARAVVETPKLVAKRRARRGDRPIDDRAKLFFERAIALDGRPRDLDAYAGLFEPKGALLSGDVTPAYSTLDARTADRLARKFPAARTCLILREPAARLWSAWRMTNEKKPDPAAADADVAAFIAFAEREAVAARSFPTAIAARWRAAFGQRFTTFFLDDIAADPDGTRAAIIAFLGGDPAKPSQLPADFNRKAKTAPSPRPPEISAYLQKRFETERLRCAEIFGGAALTWPGSPY